VDLLTVSQVAHETDGRLELSASRLTADDVPAPVREFLVWVARCPRTYDDAMQAWRSSCPRFTVWEDALAAELIQIAPCGGRIAEAQVTLTRIGHAILTRDKP